MKTQTRQKENSMVPSVEIGMISAGDASHMIDGSCSETVMFVSPLHLASRSVSSPREAKRRMSVGWGSGR